MAQDFKEKIRKLLALAESPNEHEAKSALLKARQLIAEHKLTEAELKDVEKQEVKDIMTDITCSKRRNPWVIDLSSVIGENYCCKGYRKHRRGEQTQYVGFIGFESDVELCVEIFEYAVNCILSEIKKIKKENRCYYTSYTKRLCDSFGYGFAYGISEAFKQQQEEQEEKGEQGWGLVMLIPKEVEEAASDWGKEKFTSRSEENLTPDMFRDGYYKGKEFDPTTKLKGEAAV